MMPKTMRTRRTLRGPLLGSLLVCLPAGAAEPVASIGVEPLVIRVQDAIGAPGGPAAIVFRTYASRPIRRGRLATIASSQNALAGAELAGEPDPIASYDGGQIFSAQGDVIDTFEFDETSQTLDAEFESLSATINAEDGAFGVIFVTLAAGLTPGTDYDLAVDAGVSFLTNPSDNAIAIQPRPGRLRIRGAATGLEVDVEGGPVQSGSGAVVEIGTKEPRDLASGRIVVAYDPAIALGLPVVTTDPRYGEALLTVTHPESGRVQIDFTAPAQDFNRVPGSILVLTLPTVPGIPNGTDSPISVLTGPGQSALFGPGNVPVNVVWETDPIEFEADPDIFRDGFDSGDRGFWSYLP
jgi:hypothetical protein